MPARWTPAAAAGPRRAGSLRRTATGRFRVLGPPITIRRSRSMRWACPAIIVITPATIDLVQRIAHWRRCLGTRRLLGQEPHWGPSTGTPAGPAIRRTFGKFRTAPFPMALRPAQTSFSTVSPSAARVPRIRRGTAVCSLSRSPTIARTSAERLCPCRSASGSTCSSSSRHQRTRERFDQ